MDGVKCNPNAGTKERGYAGVEILTGWWAAPKAIVKLQALGGSNNATFNNVTSGIAVEQAIPSSQDCFTKVNGECVSSSGDECRGCKENDYTGQCARCFGENAIEEMQEGTLFYECVNPAACTVVPHTWLTQCAPGYEGARCAVCQVELGYVSEGPGTFKCRDCGVAATSGDSEKMSWYITFVGIFAFFVATTIFAFFYMTAHDDSNLDRAVKKVAMHWRRINQAQKQARHLDQQAQSAKIGIPWLTENNVKVTFDRDRVQEVGETRRMAARAAGDLPDIKKGLTQVKNLNAGASSGGKIVLGNFQVLTGMTAVFTIPWPAEFTAFLKNLGSIALDAQQVFSASFVNPCQLQSSYFKGFVIQMLLPFMIGLCSFVAYFFARFFIILNKRCRQHRLNKYRRKIIDCVLAEDPADQHSGGVTRKRRRRSSIAEIIADKGYGVSDDEVKRRETMLGPAEFHKAWPHTYDALSSAFRARRRHAARKQNSRLGDPIHRHIESDAPSRWLFAKVTPQLSGEKSGKGCAWLKDCRCVCIAVSALTKLIRTTFLSFINRRFTRASMKQRVMKMFNLIAFFMYPTLCAKIFTVFKCTEIGDRRYFALDYSKECWADDWNWNIFAIVAGFGILVYVLGIPITTGYFLFQGNQSNTLYPTDSTGDAASAYMEVQKYVDHRAISETYGDIYTQYRPQNWYFELLVMLYKMTLTGGLIMVKEGTSIQILIGIVVSFVWTIVLAALQPYQMKAESHLALVSSAQVFITMLVGLALKTKMKQSEFKGIGVVLIIINVSTLVFAAGVLAMQVPKFKKLCGKRFRWKLMHCRFDMCYAETGCMYTFCIPCRKIVGGGAGGDKSDDAVILSRRRDYVGTVLPDQFFVNKYRDKGKRIRRVSLQDLRTKMGKNMAKAKGGDLKYEALQAMGGDKNVIATEMEQLNTWMVDSKLKATGLKVKLGVRVRTTRIETQLRYFYACFNPARVGDSNEQATLYGGGGDEGEHELNSLLYKTFESDLTAVSAWLAVPLVERLDSFYSEHAPVLCGTGAAEATAEHYADDLDSLLLRLTSVYETSIVEQIAEYSAVIDEEEKKTFYDNLAEEQSAHVDQLVDLSREHMGSSINAPSTNIFSRFVHGARQGDHHGDAGDAGFFDNPLHHHDEDMHDLFNDESSLGFGDGDDDEDDLLKVFSSETNPISRVQINSEEDEDALHNLFSGNNPMREQKGDGGDDTHGLFSMQSPMRARNAGRNAGAEDATFDAHAAFLHDDEEEDDAFSMRSPMRARNAGRNAGAEDATFDAHAAFLHDDEEEDDAFSMRSPMRTRNAGGGDAAFDAHAAFLDEEGSVDDVHDHFFLDDSHGGSASEDEFNAHFT